MLYISKELADILAVLRSKGDRVATALLTRGYQTSEQGNYLSFRADECQITYKPINRIMQNRWENHWAARGRMAGRPARTVRKFLTGAALEGLTDRDFEAFANNLETYRNYAGEIRLVSGADIVYWYNHYRYASHQGSLNSSCMSYARCAPYFNIYTANPDVCQMAILTRIDVDGREQLYGRALVWTLIDGRRMLDRVYGTDKTIRHMIKWAQENDISPRDQIDSTEKRVQLGRWQFRQYPYLDTLMNLNQKTGILSAYSTGESHRAVLSGTHGTDWYGYQVRYRIPIIAQASETEVVTVYAIVEGASMRGAQRRLTHQLNPRYQDVYMEHTSARRAQRVRGMAGFDGHRWRKMNDLEMRYFGMQPGTTLD